MPTASGTPTASLETLSDEQLLREALSQLRFVLERVTNGPESLLSADLRDHFIAAWPEVRTAFDTVDSSIASGNFTEKLVERGLTGAGLKLKAAGLGRAVGAFFTGAIKNVRRQLGKVFGWGNIILGSLADAIPGAEIIKEFKECVENDLKEGEAES